MHKTGVHTGLTFCQLPLTVASSFCIKDDSIKRDLDIVPLLESNKGQWEGRRHGQWADMQRHCRQTPVLEEVFGALRSIYLIYIFVVAHSGFFHGFGNYWTRDWGPGLPSYPPLSSKCSSWNSRSIPSKQTCLGSCCRPSLAVPHPD